MMTVVPQKRYRGIMENDAGRLFPEGFPGGNWISPEIVPSNSAGYPGVVVCGADGAGVVGSGVRLGDDDGTDDVGADDEGAGDDGEAETDRLGVTEGDGAAEAQNSPIRSGPPAAASSSLRQPGV
ncbi:MAG: hypothetical protein ABW046_01955 [Actinoplanes sp.]